MSESLDEKVDPAWWMTALGSDSEIDGSIVPELIAGSFAPSIADPQIQGLQRRVVETLARATSAMLEPDSWQEPFKPAMSSGDHRSALPGDLDPDELLLLAQIAPLIDHAVLQARVADVAWFYGDRKNLALLDIAISAYEAIPLEQPAWRRIGRDSWRRAIELTMRRGKAGRSHLDEIRQTFQARLIASDNEDGFLAVDLSDLLRQFIGVSPGAARPLADKCVALAHTASTDGNFRLARRLERQAAAWYSKCSDDAARCDCIMRVSEAYIAEADERGADDASAPMAASISVEKAIATLRELPRKYRVSHDLEARFVAYRARLGDLREATLEQMTTFESESIDLAEYAAGARARVAGRQKLEALAVLGQIHPLIDPEKAYEAARVVTASSIVHLLSRATFSSDGRKVAASAGELPGDTTELQVRLEIVRSFSSRVAAIGQAFILPAWTL